MFDVSSGDRGEVEKINQSLSTVAKGVKLRVEFNPANVSYYRLLGYENGSQRQPQPSAKDASPGASLGSGQAVTALYELTPAEETATATGLVAANSDTRTKDVGNKPGAMSGTMAGRARQPAPDRLAGARRKLDHADELLTLEVRWNDPAGGSETVRSNT